MFDELCWYATRDMTIKHQYQSSWTIVAERLGDTQAKAAGKIEAVKFFRRTLAPMYLRRCRDEIESYAQNTKIKNSREFRRLVENFFSYVVNSGHAPEHIYYNVRRHFFDRDLEGSATRELQEFFRNFPSAKINIARLHGYRMIWRQFWRMSKMLLSKHRFTRT